MEVLWPTVARVYGIFTFKWLKTAFFANVVQKTYSSVHENLFVLKVYYFSEGDN